MRSTVDIKARLEQMGLAPKRALGQNFLVNQQIIAKIVEAVAPKPVNVLLYGDLTPRAIADTGARRISLGAALAWKAWQAFDAAAAEFRGSLD